MLLFLVSLGFMLSSPSPCHTLSPNSSSPSMHVHTLEKSKQNSLFFTESNTIYTSQLNWMVTMVIDFKPYEEYLTYVKGQHDKLSSSLTLLKEYVHKYSIVDTVLIHLKMGMERLDISSHKIRELEHLLNDIYMLTGSNDHRHKRALFSFLGDILKGVAGIATQQDLKLITQKLQRLAESDINLAHILEHGMSLLNVTQVTLEKTVNTVNSLSSITKRIQIDMRNITAKIINDIEDLTNFETHWHQIENFISVLQDTTENTLLYYQTLYSQVSDILNHKVTPSVIPPSKLHEILVSISQVIPHHLSLPYDIESELLSYYQYIKCTGLRHTQGLLLVMSIPILSELSKFTIFRIHNVPVPDMNVNTTLTYDVKHEFLAISADQTKYVILSEHLYHKCAAPNVKFCDFNRPILSIDNVINTCEFSVLFRKDVSTCNVHVKSDPFTYPNAFYIANGTWSIPTRNEFNIHLECLDNSKSDYIVKPPIDLITLPLGCKGYSTDFILPSRFVHESKFVLKNTIYIPQPNISLYLTNSTSNKVKGSVIYSVPRQISFSNKEKDVNSVLKDLHNHVNDMYDFKRTLTIHKTHWKLILVLVLVVIVLISATFLCLRFKLYKMFSSKFLFSKPTTDDNKPSPIVTFNKGKAEVEIVPKPLKQTLPAPSAPTVTMPEAEPLYPNLTTY